MISIKNIALVTGATGFIGSHLIKSLIDNQWEVHAIIRPNSNINTIKHMEVGLKVYDGTTESIVTIVDTVKPSTVFHLATTYLAQHDSSDIIPMINSNVMFGTQLVEAMVKCGVTRLINTGTSAQHFNNESYNPVCLYAATKQAFEAILDYYVQAFSLQVITLKLFDTYGPADSRRKLFTVLNEAASEKKSLVMSPGEQLIDIVYIDDVIRAFLVAAKILDASSNIRHERYAVSSGNPITLKELVKFYEKVTQVKLSIEWGVLPYRTREVMILWNSGMPLPGWNPEISLEEGIARIRKI